MRSFTCAANEAGVASVTLDVATRPVFMPLRSASSRMVTTSSSLPARVEMRPRLVAIPVAMDVALFAESAT